MSELDRYDYELPKQLVAQQPLATRSDARLLVVDRHAGTIRHQHIYNLPEILAENDCLVINDTRVVPARLIGTRAQTGGAWEGLFLAADASGAWQLLGKTRGKLAEGETIELQNRFARPDISLRMIEKREGGVWIARPETDEPLDALLDRVGRVPLPPYIRGGEMMEDDRQRYQTVFARHPGAVAAPTAGLHFTNELLNKLIDRGLSIAKVTLHVGADTFRPIKTDRLAEHAMHFETGVIDRAAVDTINRARAAGGRAVAVGTTCVRVLETAGRSGTLAPWSGQTDLFIRPPYEFRVVDALLTNFHLPRTTLLVLVRTFGGDELIARAYSQAIEREYRFYSYGDAMLIL